jgi:hypothetical protein
MRTWVAPWFALLACTGCDHRSSAGTAGVPSGAAIETGIAPADVTLPASSSTTVPAVDPLVVVLSHSRLALGRDAPLAVPNPDSATWAQGFDAKYKRASRNDLFLVPLGSAMGAAFPGDASVGDVAIAASASISYRMLTETMYTLGQERVVRVAILVRSGAEVRAIPIKLPRPGDNLISPTMVSALLAQLAHDGGPGAPSATPPPRASSDASTSAAVSLSLNVIGTDGGFVVSAAGQRMGPGCHEPGTGIAVPRHDDAYDFAGLAACATTIKASSPTYAGETRVTVTLNAGLDVQLLVSTLDALRGTGGALFPEVLLGVPH